MPYLDCPSCGAEHHQPPDLIGLVADCPKCGKAFRVTEDGETDEPVVRRRKKKSIVPLLITVAGGVAIAGTWAMLAWRMQRPQPPARGGEAARADPLPVRANPSVDPKPPRVRRLDGDLDSGGGIAGDGPVPPGGAGAVVKLPVPGQPTRQPLPPWPPAPAVPPAPVIPPPPAREFVSDRPDREAFPGYFKRVAHGFTVNVSRMAYEESDARAGEALAVIDGQLARIAEGFPDATLKTLRAVPVWVEWDHTTTTSATAYAVYYSRGDTGLAARGLDPRKAGCVCILSLKRLHEMAATKGVRQNAPLWAFAHAVNDRVTGFNSPWVDNAFRQAQARRLYDRVLHDSGRVGPAAAGKSADSYFAELTCAYFDRLDYAPHDRAELREFDPVGYELMTKVWGTPEQIEAARKRRAR